MAATAPHCNVTVVAPAPSPFSPKGFRQLSPNATLADVISAVNNNFSPQAQEQEFNRLLAKNLNDPKGSVRAAADKQISKIHFIQKAIVRQKIKVENPQDKEQWIIDDRILSLVMTDQRTGADWIWRDPSGGKGVQAGNPETE